MTPSIPIMAARETAEEEQQAREEREQVLEHLARTISGEKMLSLEYRPVEKASYATIEGKRIRIGANYSDVNPTGDEQSLLEKADTLHEAEHIRWTGSARKALAKLDANWRKAFLGLLNGIEDVRIENIGCTIYPQARRYHVAMIQKYIKEQGKDGVLVLKNPFVAIRCGLENKIPVPWRMAESCGKEYTDFVNEAVAICKRRNVIEGNFEDVVAAGEEIFPLYVKLAKSEMGKAHGQTQKAQADASEAKNKMQAAAQKLNQAEAEGDSAKAKEAREEKEKQAEAVFSKDREASELAQEEINLSYKFKKEQGKDGLYSMPTDILEEKNGGKDSKLDLAKAMKKAKEEQKEIDRYESPFADVKLSVNRYTSEYTRFNNAGQAIPNLALAKETGKMIASELMRRLQLKNRLVSRKSSGKLDMDKIRSQVMRHGEIRTLDIFQQPRKLLPDHSVLVMIDMSGSMSENRKLSTAKQSVATLSSTLAALNVNYCVRGYNAESSEEQISDIMLKDWGKGEIDYAFLERAGYPNHNSVQNRDGDSWRLGAKELEGQKGRKLLIVVSDGEPNHGGTSYEGAKARMDTKEAVKEIEAKGIVALGISIDSAANKFIGKVFRNHFFFDGDNLHKLQDGLTETYIDAIHGG